MVSSEALREGVRIGGRNFPLASSCTNTPSIDDNLVPLAFKMGSQYMAETPAVVEAQIVVKELELLREYDSHQGRPLLVNYFWIV